MGLFRNAARMNAMTSEELAEHIFQMTGLNGGMTKAGEYVSTETAMRLSVVYACIKVITQTFAATPLFLMEDGAGGIKSKAVRHPLYRALKDAAMPDMPAFRWREESMFDLLTDGNAFSQIIRNGRGQTIGLNYLPAPNVALNRKPGDPFWEYVFTDMDGKQYRLQRQDVLHIPGMGEKDGRGLSPIGMARETIGKGLAASGYGSDFFNGGGRIGSVVAVEGGVAKNPETWEAFQKTWREKYESPASGGPRLTTAFIDGGVSYTRLTATPEEAQFLETIKATDREICGIYGVPPHMIGDLERATFSNIEHQAIEFIQNTMVPWFVRFESYIGAFLLSEFERRHGYYAKFNANAWLRGDSEARANMYQTMRQNGILNADEIRELEDWNPQEGGVGKRYYINGAMTPVMKEGEQPIEPEE